MDQLNQEHYVQCPIQDHSVPRKRFARHIIKCRKAHPEIELKQCPFNNSHVLKEADFQTHVVNCPDRKVISQYESPLVEEVEQVRIENEENWGDLDADDYDPKTYTATAKVLRRPEGLQPSARKNFVKQERKRLADDLSDEDIKPVIKEESLVPPSPPSSINWGNLRSCSPDLKRSRSRSPNLKRSRCRSRSPRSQIKFEPDDDSAKRRKRRALCYKSRYPQIK